MRKKFRFLTVLAVCVMVLSCFSVTAFAYADDTDQNLPVTEATQPEQQPETTPAPEKSKGEPIDDEGNAYTRDLLYDKATNKQFITVQTKSGNTFFIVIDYDAPINEDEEQYQTYFLNMVDESDLLALLDDDTAAALTTCNCKEKCAAGQVNTDCPVCKTNMSECTGTAPVTPEPDKDAETDVPAGKKPIVMSQDDVCYYEYMTDSDGDGKPDKGGDGFASRLLVKDGKLTCEYVDADGQTLYGSYDLVPLLDDFLEQHPDFSYRGARATIAVTGYQGAFGYRISSDYQAKLGAEAFAQACKDAREVADALRAEGYTIASHSYGHLTYGDISPERLAGDAQKWNDQIAAVIGETDVLLYPFGSDIAGIEAYKGAKFDTLYGLGFRYFCNVDSAEHWVQIHDGYVRQGRRNIDGYRMYYQPNLLDDLFDTKTVWDDARPTPVPKI